MKTTDLISIAGGLALTFSTAACDLGEKNVGSETDGASGGTDGGGTDDGGTDDGGSDGATNGNSTSPTAGSTDDGGTDDADTGADTGGEYDPCAGLECGAGCNPCPPDDEDCAVPPIETVCDEVGECVAQTGDICTGTTLGPSFEDGLTSTFGCGDVYLYAVDDADTVLMSLSAIDLIEMSNGAEEPQQYVLDLADGGALSLTVDVGQYASAYACNDAIENEPVITESWTAVSGTVVIDLGVPDEFGNTLASATITDVVIETGVGEQLTVASFTFPETFVGWLPG